MRVGVTESFWNQRMQEQDRFLWTVFVYVLSVVGAASITKTPYPVLNGILSVYVGLNSIFIIHFQRKFSTFPLRFRRIISRYSLRMFLVGWYVVAMGATVAAVLLIFQLTGFSRTAVGVTNSWRDLGLLLAITLLLGAMWLGELKEWGWFLWVFTFPREAFVRHIASRTLQVKSFKGFAAFEIYVVSYSFIFVYLFSLLVQVAVVLYAF